MTHRFPLKEIARQSGLSTATIDRAINNRAHVSPQTKARVSAAISELEGQEAQLSARGRRMFFDFIVEAPNRFSREVKNAAQHVLPRIGAAVCRPRFIMHEIMDEDDVVRILERIGTRGSQGVCLKVRDVPRVHRAVEKLIKAGIPVVTLVTDLTSTRRIAYVGLDNQSAGRTAAFLVSKAVGDMFGTVLTIRSDARFHGEEEREEAFNHALSAFCPNLRTLGVSGGLGVHASTTRIVQSAIEGLDHLRAVYSMGGGNHSILDVLDQNGLHPDIFIAHDLDQDNAALIQANRIDFVLHHDLRADMENVFYAFLHHHKLTAVPLDSGISNVQVITPLNVPNQLGPL